MHRVTALQVLECLHTHHHPLLWSQAGQEERGFLEAHPPSHTPQSPLLLSALSSHRLCWWWLGWQYSPLLQEPNSAVMGGLGRGESGKERRKEEGYIKFKVSPGFNNNILIQG